MLVATPDTVRDAAAHLSRYDAVLRPVITRAGLSTISPHHEYYRELVESIVGQQLSVKAAASIRHRFIDLFAGTFPDVETLLTKSPEELRAAGLSRAKAAYIHDLARHVLENKVSFDHLDNLPNDEVVVMLTDIKGVGEWTAHMFLIFCMGRLDVLPIGDLGIRSGVRILYGLRDLPTPRQIQDIALHNHWHPYESIASWYIWEFLDNKPAENL